MTIERAIEILDPEHREHYESIEPVNEACRMGMNALKELAELDDKIESAKMESAKETTLKIIDELNRIKNIIIENYGINERVGVDIAINLVDAFYKELTK